MITSINEWAEFNGAGAIPRAINAPRRTISPKTTIFTVFLLFIGILLLLLPLQTLVL